jgi:hypothetical protein
LGLVEPNFLPSQPTHNRTETLRYSPRYSQPSSKNPSYNLSLSLSLPSRARPVLAQREWRRASTLFCSSERPRRACPRRFTLWSSSTSAIATLDALTKPSASSARSSVRSCPMAPLIFATLMLFLTASPLIRSSSIPNLHQFLRFFFFLNF